ncbi:MAG: RecQ family ATP-dependent DNA helicase [Bacteroidales bacterium]|nr:RecQ family ATP-dependent DNA helicase [Bacteroidales bacterium]
MEDISGILKRYWGYDSFRPMQREIIESVLSGHDTLGLMPTGGGKSVTFQVPGLALGGLTIVVTPLIALMKDQVDNLRSRGIKAAFMHSGMPYGETSRVWQALLHGGCRFLYVSPERLASERFCQELRGLKRVTLVVVDEAHCISQWGYDFRPSYLNIARLRKILPPVPFMAVTASATPEVADDIMRVLEFRNPRKFATSFARPNISYVVRPVTDKIGQTLHILNRVPGTAIVYVRSRRRTLEIAKLLSEAGVSAAPFHAGMDYEVKEERINAWKSGAIRVIVSTNAFGMGIDKPDVRLVIHHDLPPSIEEYYQEAGRAGRDGLPSYAVILLDGYDCTRLRMQLANSFPKRDYIEKNYELICVYLGIEVGAGFDKLYEFDLPKFLSIFKVNGFQISGALDILGAAGYMEYVDETENASRAMILCTKEELYDIPAAGRFSDSVLRSLLRNCPGLFSDYVYFTESRIATDAGCTPQEVYDTLLALSRLGVVSYVPRRRTPYIYMPTAREDDPKYLQIPRSAYQDRRLRMEQRIESMIAYAENGYKCRQRMILEYFGEQDVEDCGTCDVCRKNRRPATMADVRALEKNFMENLRKNQHGIHVNEIKALYGAQSARVIAFAEELTDEGTTLLLDGRYILKAYL